MKNRILAFALAVTLLFPKPSKADLFGGDVAVLANILVQTIQQLNQLRMIFAAGRDTLTLMSDINRGINDSLNLLRTISPNIDPGIYGDWQKGIDTIAKVQSIYGIPVSSKDQRVQKDADQSIAETVALNNSIYQYANEIDQIGEQIKSQSHFVSPGGAQKLTAQTLGVMLHVLNQSLRAQATGLKLQAQALAIQNKHDKDATAQTLNVSNTLGNSMHKEVAFTLPRF